MKYFDVPIKHSTYIDVLPAKVYQCLTTAKGWNAWFTKGMKLDLRQGGSISFRWENFAGENAVIEDTGPILEFEESHRFVFQWHPQGKEYPTTVAFTLSPRGEGTVLGVEETGYLDTPEGHRIFNSCATGWVEAMTLLKFYLESGLTYKHPKT